MRIINVLLVFWSVALSPCFGKMVIGEALLMELLLHFPTRYVRNSVTRFVHNEVESGFLPPRKAFEGRKSVPFAMSPR